MILLIWRQSIETVLQWPQVTSINFNFPTRKSVGKNVTSYRRNWAWKKTVFVWDRLIGLLRFREILWRTFLHFIGRNLWKSKMKVHSFEKSKIPLHCSVVLTSLGWDGLDAKNCFALLRGVLCKIKGRSVRQGITPKRDNSNWAFSFCEVRVWYRLVYT